MIDIINKIIKIVPPRYLRSDFLTEQRKLMRNVPALPVAASLIASFIPPALASDICYKPVLFRDIFTLSQIPMGANTLLFGNEYANVPTGRANRYSIPVAGSLEPVPLSNPAVNRIGLHGVNVYPLTLAPVTLAVINCDGRAPGNFNVAAAMAKIDCANIHSAASAAAAGSRALGD
jgi:hypothetical protein